MSSKAMPLALARGFVLLTPVETMFAMEFHYLEAWIREVALRDEFWQSQPTASERHQPRAAPSGRTPRIILLWHMVRSNNAFVQQFQTILDTEMFHCCFVTFSRLCGILIGHAKVAWALLEDVRGPADDAPLSSGDPLTLTETQKAEARMILDDVGYLATIEALLSQFEVVTRGPLTAGWTKNIIVQFCTKLRAFSLCYSKQSQRILGPDGAAVHEAFATHARGLPVTATEMNRWVGLMSPSALGEINGGDFSAGSWPTVAEFAETSELMDQLLWDSVLNNFRGGTY